MKRDYLVASMYRGNTIKIPYSRLVQILLPKDIIYGSCTQIPVSSDCVEYQVTHVAWWGVYAKPTQRMLDGLRTIYIPKHKGHIKFKWQNITGVDFKPVMIARVVTSEACV